MRGRTADRDQGTELAAHHPFHDELGKDGTPFGLTELRSVIWLEVEAGRRGEWSAAGLERPLR